MQKLSFDIFCQVIDNYGDIGVCWRLSKQLSLAPFNAKVRLWVDDLSSFKKLQPKIKTNQKHQFIENIEIILWQNSTYESQNIDLEITPYDVVIEAFACEIPSSFRSKLNPENHIWLNLEYLSAESWVKEFHLQPSPQHNGMIKYFYMPGFIENTGGLIREFNLQKNIEKPELFTKFAINNDIKIDSLLITYFCYANARFDLLVKAIAKQEKNVSIIMPQGLKLNYADTKITEKTGLIQDKALSLMLGFEVPDNLQVFVIPFVDQLLFDQILFNADINFVRGEDSLVRAIWAQKPFIWQPYIQEQNLHITKLEALLNISKINNNTKQMMLDWSNTEYRFTDSFCEALHPHNYNEWLNESLEWSQQLAKQKDLATALIDFVKSKRDCDIR